MSNFPIDPHCKNRPFSATLPKADDFYNGGLWRNSLPVVDFLMQFGTRVRLKTSNDRGEFEIDRTMSKNNIAENSIALGHETHNT